MKKSIQSVILAFVVLTVLLSGCAPASTPVTSTFTSSPIRSTFTPEPTSTATSIPSPTSLAGSVVLPVDTLSKSIPWLPLDKSAVPSTYFFYFNLSKPPFNSVLVRQAFAAAIDRNALVEIAKKYGAKNPQPATTFTPSETLGRDLYNEVGIPFNPAHAKELLTQAGYTDPSKFPSVTLLISTASSDVPGFHVKITESMIDMWQQYLGVKVTYEVLDRGTFFSRIDSNPSEIFRLIWKADFNDPDNFLKEIFHSGSQYNYGGFSNSEFDKLVDLASKSNDPAKRQELYIQAEYILCETETAIIPIYHATLP
jgi:oligopeptide transport system substrate-binding protein